MFRGAVKKNRSYRFRGINKPIPVGINENRHLVEYSSNCNRKAITVGKNIQKYWLKNQRKLNVTTIHIHTNWQIDNTQIFANFL